MVWVTIPDEEIEPEKPVTSILLHKLRDNPEAIAAGLPGAPKILTPAINDLAITNAKYNDISLTSNKIATDTGTFSFTIQTTIQRFVNPGGRGGWSPSFWITSGATGIFMCQFMDSEAATALTQVSVPWLAASKGSPAGVLLYIDSLYITPITPLSMAWFFRRVNIADPTDISTWFSGLSLAQIMGTPDAPSHPFGPEDPADYITEVVPISADILDILKIETVPIEGGGWMTPDLWTGDPVPPMDPTRPQRSINKVILENYDIAPGGIWPTDEQFIKVHPLDPKQILMEIIPAPAGVEVCQLIPK